MPGTVVIKILADAKQAVKTIDDVGDKTEKSSKRFQTLHKAGAAAGTALAGGLLAAGAAAVSFTKKAAEDQQSASRLAQTLGKAAGATKAQKAAVEEWITAQGKAVGVADDDLRPALSKLAIATGSVTKAQKLAKLAMDISAGSGRDLQSVAFALAKAQNGNVAGLSRLGVQTTKTSKDTVALEKAQTAVKSAQLSYTAAIKAHGKSSAQARIAADKLKQAQEGVGAAQAKTKKTTLSLGAITNELSSQYGGAASKNAKTAAGKQKILTVQMQELQEQIGYKLIPVMLTLATVGLKVVTWISNNTKTAGVLLATLGALLAVVASINLITKAFMATQAAWNTVMLLSGKLTLGTRIQMAALFVQEKAGAAVTKGMAAAQWVLNAAMSANPITLVVLAIAALVVGMVIAYKKSATFRAIVQGAFRGVLAAGSAVAGFFTKKIPAAFHKVVDAASDVLGWVKSHWPIILAVLAGPIGLAVLAITKNWDKIKAGALGLVGFFKTISGRILGALSGLPAKLRGIFSGLWSDLAGGLKTAINAVLHLPLTIPRINTHIPGVGTVGGQTLIPALAKGGIVTKPTLALVGEAGPEAVVPLSGKQGLGNVYNVSVQAAPNERISETVPRALSILELLYG